MRSQQKSSSDLVHVFPQKSPEAILFFLPLLIEHLKKKISHNFYCFVMTLHFDHLLESDKHFLKQLEIALMQLYMQSWMACEFFAATASCQAMKEIKTPLEAVINLLDDLFISFTWHPSWISFYTATLTSLNVTNRILTGYVSAVEASLFSLKRKTPSPAPVDLSAIKALLDASSSDDEGQNSVGPNSQTTSPALTPAKPPR